ncbi:hypothetical protein SAMN05192561_101728 [Halopenitus malekzadehii]|uniref:KEOPS complex subunit Pcc1 n=1 Tax=Halopenitus malekzadehii TaxID=1267564 RepID=A0A1H6I464_9EURY|nr:KEOPS complex subunit Pcc1 [Halopenitus malekzadehii]SEH41065.1 hypothetical protein SAMN05192561_101728 [Halopenitus malekzadehii]
MNGIDDGAGGDHAGDTDAHPGDGAGGRPARTATVRTRHDDPELVRDALAPDNTDSMDARVDDDAVVCSIERETTGGLQSTVDDYLVNLQVADRLVDRGAEHRHMAGETRDEGRSRSRDRDRDVDPTNRQTTDTDTTHQT